MQIFTKMANRWAERECEPPELESFRAAVAATDLRGAQRARQLSHQPRVARSERSARGPSSRSSASSDAAKRSDSARSCHTPATSWTIAPADSRETPTRSRRRSRAFRARFALLLETTAGSGTALGATFEELAAIIARSARRDATTRRRLHRHRTHFRRRIRPRERDYDDVIARFDDNRWPRATRRHALNDSKAPLGSRRDRHELIGEGAIGALAFRRIMADDRLAAVPKVIETPKLDDAQKTDRRMLRRLRRFAAG